MVSLPHIYLTVGVLYLLTGQCQTFFLIFFFSPIILNFLFYLMAIFFIEEKICVCFCYCYFSKCVGR